jgi:hypothetical protein
MLPFLASTNHRCHSYYQRQQQLKRRAGMQFAPKREQRIRYPASQAQRMMQPHVAADAQRNEQRLRVMAVTMTTRCRAAAASASEAVTFKNQLAQTAEPAQGMTAAIAKPGNCRDPLTQSG